MPDRDLAFSDNAADGQAALRRNHPQTPPRNGHARGVRWKRGPTPAPVAARGFSPSSPSAGGPEQVRAYFLRDPRCICAARGKGRDGSGEQKAECVKGEERCEYQECVGGCLRLSATDFALRVLHERDEASRVRAFGRGWVAASRSFVVVYVTLATALVWIPLILFLVLGKREALPRPRLRGPQ